MRRHNFKELHVWKKSMQLVTEIYSVTNHFPNEELFGLTQQIRRCSVSIPSNIAEGCGRGTDPQLKHFLNIAQGSAFELETQFMIAQRLGFLEPNKSTSLRESCSEIQRMIDGFSNKLGK